MKLRRTIWLATLCALLFSAFAPRADAVWQCEGRTCGTTPWLCCCVSPTEFQDAHCRPSGEPAPGAGLCSSACACVLSIRALAGLPMVAPRFSAPDFHPAMPCSLSGPAAPLPVEARVRSFEMRGPPPARVLLTPPSLRAPPAA